VTLNVWMRVTNNSDEPAIIEYLGPDNQPNAYNGEIAPGAHIDYPYCDPAVPMVDSTQFDFELGWGPFDGNVSVKNPWIDYPYWYWANMTQWMPDGSTIYVENDRTVKLGEPDTQVTQHGVYVWTIHRYNDGTWSDPSGDGQTYKCIECVLTKETGRA